jgi:hypothetical protein
MGDASPLRASPFGDGFGERTAFGDSFGDSLGGEEISRGCVANPRCGLILSPLGAVDGLRPKTPPSADELRICGEARTGIRSSSTPRTCSKS